MAARPTLWRQDEMGANGPNWDGANDRALWPARQQKLEEPRGARRIAASQPDATSFNAASTSPSNKTAGEQEGRKVFNEQQWKKQWKQPKKQQEDIWAPSGQESGEVAVVQQLGSRANSRQHRDSTAARSQRGRAATSARAATTLSTIAAQSSQSRIVVALLRDGDQLQLKIQEMRPAIFEVGANLAECRRFRDEHATLLRNLKRQKEAPLENWMTKYKKLEALEGRRMTNELRLVYLCMADNLQGCWRALLSQLEQRLRLLESTCLFYGRVEQLRKSLELADNHVQASRREFFAAPNSGRFARASRELQQMNEQISSDFLAAKTSQVQLVELIGEIGLNNLGDARDNLLAAEAQSLVRFIASYLEPLERRKIQLEQVSSSSSSSSSQHASLSVGPKKRPEEAGVGQEARQKGESKTSAARWTQEARVQEKQQQPAAQKSAFVVRDMGNFNELTLAESWLDSKVGQLNSSLLSSLGMSAPDTRSILSKHEQVALECAAIEGALLAFNNKQAGGRPLRAPGEEQQVGVAAGGDQQKLAEQQRQLANRTRQVISILEARIVLLRRTADFYARARRATSDIGKMMRRLQVDNSLQSVQFVADELELKDVSSIVASGATIISELQQLQLAQQQGQRSNIVGLSLATSGIRSVIDQLSQDLAHLKTVLSQRRLVLLNEDASKMAQNFSNKCHQLKFWLDEQAKGFLLANSRLPFEPTAARAFCQAHENLRSALRQKTQEVEALLRLLATLTENLGANSDTAGAIRRDSDELSQDWITLTNCLERRLELARKHVAILESSHQVGRQLDLLARSHELQLKPANENEEAAEDQRTPEEIGLDVEQSLARLGLQVQQFARFADETNTALVASQPLDSGASVNDFNKLQLVGHANGALKLLQERNKATLNKLKARGARRWPEEAPTSQKAAGSEGKREPEVSRTAKETAAVAPQASGQQREEVAAAAAAKQPREVAQAAVPKRRPSIQMAPEFLKPLRDLEVEPFSSVVLECELDPASTVNLAGNYTHQIKVEWLLNNKRIPANIKHSTASEANRHRLTISQFGPTCCGTYTAHALNQLNGQWASSSCRLRLAGIREVEDAAEVAASSQPRPAELLNEVKGASLASGNSERQQLKAQRQATKERALERIIQGVGSPANQDESRPAPVGSGRGELPAGAPPAEQEALFARLPVTQATYKTSSTRTQQQEGAGKQQQQQQQQQQQHLSIDYIDSSQAGRSSSRSPFEGTPQPPVFIQGLNSSHLDGLVCVVMGNPPPQVEWLHDGRPIASARCAPSAGELRANVCKLTIETSDDKTRGQFVCRATNRLGQSTTALQLAK